MGVFDQYARSIPAKVEPLSICPQCGREFKPTNKWQRFCETKCRATWFRIKTRQKGSVFCDMTHDGEPEIIKDDPKKPTIDVFASFQADRPPAHDEP